ncbi:MAG: hypothetical protein L6Q33_10910 [Bacteriovoracaceae bacterium]|nr:hypothetical protein [Bacteriovoracaceae bacterium]
MNEKQLMDVIFKNFGFEVFTPGLLRTKPLYDFYVNYFKNLNIPIVIIAGTNGKGETAHSLSWLLNHQGINAYTWTSPHIFSICERYSFAGEDVSLARLSMEVEAALLDYRQLEFKVSFYEFLFWVFLRLVVKDIDQSKKNVIVLEVGLGGRLDAVNHFAANIVLLNSISRDHKEILGNRYDIILGEKCGVFRANQYVVSALELAYLRQNVHDQEKEMGLNYFDLFENNILNAETDFSDRNRKLALSGFEILREKFFKISSVKTMTYSEIHWPIFKGRSEKMTYKGKEFIFVGAHNLDGMRKLVARMLKEEKKGLRPITFLVSFSKRDFSETKAMLKMLLGLRGSLHLTNFNHPKAQESELLHKLTTEFSEVSFELSWMNYLEDFCEIKSAESILITGSYYFIGEVQSYLRSKSS